MRMQKIVLGIALSMASVIAAKTPAVAEEYRGTFEQQMACTSDVWRLCFGQIPDVGRITACLRENTPQLSGACRAVFESNASMPPDQPAPVAPPKGRSDRAKPGAVQ
jgi:hypothetical protein